MSKQIFQKFDVEFRKKYTASQEFAVLRQKEEKPEEFTEYNDYCEWCKSEIKRIYNL